MLESNKSNDQRNESDVAEHPRPSEGRIAVQKQQSGHTGRACFFGGGFLVEGDWLEARKRRPGNVNSPVSSESNTIEVTTEAVAAGRKKPDFRKKGSD